MDTSENFSAEELYFLFGLHAPAAIIGFTDPTLGLLADEIDAMFARAQERLLKRQIIAAGADGKWVVQEPTARWVTNVANPTHSLLIAYQDTRSAEVLRSYHFAMDNILELSEEQSGQYSLHRIDHTSKIFDSVLTPLAARHYAERGESPVIVSGKGLTRAHDLIERGQTAQVQALFQNSFSAPEQANRFIEAILHPVTRFSLIVFLDRNQPGMSKTKGFSVLAGQQDIWLLIPESANLEYVRVRSITKAELVETLNSCLPKRELAL